MSLLSDSDCRRVEDAVRALEKKSSTELVVAVVPRSSDYAMERFPIATVVALATAIAFLHFLPQLDPTWTLILEVPVGILAFYLAGRGVAARLLIARRSLVAAVEERAFELFASRGLYRTRDRTGMLILLSELERRVVILGDRGIHERVGDVGWKGHVDHILAAIQRGDAVTGLLEVIERLGAVHAELAPARGDDANELPDEVVRG